MQKFEQLNLYRIRYSLETQLLADSEEQAAKFIKEESEHDEATEFKGVVSVDKVGEAIFGPGRDAEGNEITEYPRKIANHLTLV